MNKILNILKILILISLIFLFFSASFTTKNHCETCKFNLEGEKISASKFVNDYFEECINPYVKQNSYGENINISGLEVK